VSEAVLFIYVAAMVAIGIKARAHTLERFILGDQLSTRAMVATVASTFYGASAILGGVSLTYQVGLGVLWFILPFYLGNVLLILWVSKIARARKCTLPDFLGDFYGREFAIASAILLTTLCLIPEEIIAGGKILAAFTALPVEAAMGVMAFVLIAPVAIGGMKADVMTDIAQFALMLLMLGAVAPAAFGPGIRAAAGLPAEMRDPFAFLSIQEIVVLTTLLFFLPLTSAPLYQRFFVSESAASARKAVVASIAIWAAIDLIVVLSGFAALSAFPALADPDLALIEIGQTLPGLARGVFFVGLLAAIMSTVNSFLQSGAASLAYDVMRHLRPALTSEQLLWVSRVGVVILGLASLGIALWFQSIVPALLFTLTMWTCGMLAPTLAALAGKRLPPRAALICLLSGAGSALIWQVWQPFDVDPLFVGLGASLVVAIIAGNLPVVDADL